MEEKTFFKGDWKVVEKLGEGSFGIVYKAVKEQFGVKSYSAIKQIMIPQVQENYERLKLSGMTVSNIEKSYESQANKWKEEIIFLERFKDSVNIVSIEDFEILKREDGPGRIINIRMELLQNIEDYFLNKIVTDKDILKMAIDILSALEECEEKKVVHRDIKPGNIFVNSKGIYKVGDFGEAKNIERTISNMSRKGTENYMAPEILKGEKGSKSVDTYSLGIMLYKYFNNNRLPFLPEYPKDVLYEDIQNAISKRMRGENMKSPCKATNQISKIILKACNYNQEERYQSAKEFKEELTKEYRKIQVPLELFDFQKNVNEKVDMTGGFIDNRNVSNYYPTSGFNNKKIDDSITEGFDKTSGVFKDNIESNNDFEKSTGIYNENDRSVKSYNETIGVFDNSSNNKKENFDGTVGVFYEDNNNDKHNISVLSFGESNEEKKQFGFDENTAPNISNPIKILSEEKNENLSSNVPKKEKNEETKKEDVTKKNKIKIWIKKPIVYSVMISSIYVIFIFICDAYIFYNKGYEYASNVGINLVEVIFSGFTNGTYIPYFLYNFFKTAIPIYYLSTHYKKNIILKIILVLLFWGIVDIVF